MSETTARQIRVTELLAAVRANEEFGSGRSATDALEVEWHDNIIPESIARAIKTEEIPDVDDVANVILEELCIVYKLAYTEELNRIINEGN